MTSRTRRPDGHRGVGRRFFTTSTTTSEHGRVFTGDGRGFTCHYVQDPIGVAERLGITLRYLASGMSQKDVARYFCVGQSTVCNIIQEVCQAIWDALGPEFLPRPTPDHWKRVAEEFNIRWNFPNCLGAIDGKHIQIQKPALSGSTYFNYKRTFSTVLMAVADASYKFLYVDLGAYGREHDASIFAQSAFGTALQDGTLQLPQANNGDLPYVFIETVDKLVKAMCVLHNFMREKEGLNSNVDVEPKNVLGNVAGRLGANMYSPVAERVRVSFTDYFSSPQGSLPFQVNMVNRGQL
ncbi:hypothetical protein Pcinc_006046 [Petrolisthes cinctipes]|uniref:DDE Tnp4 domain-containing protein n=1 Tax=Petrolisthes cinctipes TaxID=88211 RepID=A0AAE1GDS6_PETCI|nr:hypothetical protein Pcinc_006046 [Petrolisthes cinctipes]